MVRWLTILAVLLWSAGAWAADGDPLTSNYGLAGAGVDEDGELGGTPLSNVSSKTTATVNCSAGSISSTSIVLTSGTNFDSKGAAAICNVNGKCNNFKYTGKSTNTLTGVTNATNGGLSVCTGNYTTADSSEVLAYTTLTTAPLRANVLKDAVRRTQMVVGEKVVTPASLNVTTCSAAQTAIGSVNKTILRIDSNLNCAATTTFTSNITLQCQGGLLDLDSTASALTIQGPVNCDGTLFTDFVTSSVSLSGNSYVEGIKAAWWGAVDGGDASTAFLAAMYAARGTGTVNANKSHKIIIGAGVFTVSQKKVFELNTAHKGIIIEGQGPHNTVISYTYNAAEADNYLFYWNNTTGGAQIHDILIQNFSLVGPIDPDSGTNNAGILFAANTTGGSARWTFRNLYANNWDEGFYIGNGASDVQLDTLRVENSLIWDTTYHFTFDCSQALGHSILSTVLVHPTAGGDIFRIIRGGKITCVACDLIPQGAGAIVHYPSTAATTRQGNKFIGGHIELQGTSVLVQDDTTTGNSELVEFFGVSIGTVAGAPRNVANLQDAAILLWDGGVLNGSVTLTSSTSADTNVPPQLVVKNAVWLNSGVTESYTGNSRRPVVKIEGAYGDPLLTLPLPDRDTGPMILGSRGAFARPRKVAYLAREDGTTFNYTLAGNVSAGSITLPTGSNITAIRIVCTEAQNGANGTWTIDNGDGSVVYITQAYTSGNTAFTTEYDPQGSLTEVSGNSAIVRLGGTGFSQFHDGYVEIEYE